MTRRAALAAALALAALLPAPNAPATLSKGVALLVVALVAAALGHRGWRASLPLAFAAGLPALLIVTMPLALHADAPALLPWLLPGTVALAAGEADEASRRRLAVEYATHLSLGAGCIAVWQQTHGASVEGGFGYPNALGLVVAPCLPLLWSSLVRLGPIGTSPRGTVFQHRVALASAVAFGLFAVAASRSRTASLGLFLVTCIALFRWRRMLGVIVLGAGMLIALSFRGELVSALSGRIWIARVGLDAARDALPLGAGIGGYSFAFLEAQARLMSSMTVEAASATFVHAVSPHGDWLGLLATAGPLGLLLALGMGVMAWRGNLDSGSRGALMVLAVLAVGDDTWSLPPVGALIGILLPVGTCAVPASKARSYALAGIVLAMGAFVLPAGVRRFAAQLELHRAERSWVDEDEYRGFLERARAIDPSDGEVALAAGLASLASGDPEQALRELDDAKSRIANVGTFVAIGNAKLALGEVHAAIESYQEARRLDPGSFRAHANLVEAHRRAGELELAERSLAAARRLQPHHPKLAKMAEALARDTSDAATVSDDTRR